MIAVITSPLFDFLFDQYASYATADIVAEAIAVALGLWSVWLAKKNHIGVYPTGMLSTAIFVYLLWKWMLLGDMLINAYYFVMSVYGWVYWGQKKEGQRLHPIESITAWEKIISAIYFLSSLGFVYLVYRSFGMWENWTAYVDTFTTAIFFVGMWLMARRKIEHWLFWIVGDLISIPLYLYKGLALTSFQYCIFTLIAFYGYRAWKQAYNNRQQAA